MTDPTVTLPAVLRDFAQFLRRPRVLVREGWRGPGNVQRWAWLAGLQVVVLIGLLLPLLKVWQSTFTLPNPEAFDQMPKAWLVPFVVVIAPVLEELLFRAWHSGTRTALWLLGCAVLAAGAVALAISPATAPAAVGLLVLAIVLAIAGWWRLRRRVEPVAWFVRIYPVVFYLTAAAFALVHLSNYPHPGLISLPLVLPQLWAGLMLAYIRQRISLSAGIAAHIFANSCTLALAFALG